MSILFNMNVLWQQLYFGLFKVKSEYTLFAPIFQTPSTYAVLGNIQTVNSECAVALTKYKLALGQEAESTSSWQKVSNPSASEGIWKR